MLLIGATIAALAIPAIAAADHDLATDHGLYSPQEKWQPDVDVQASRLTLVVFSGLSPEACRFYEMNIPEYECDMTLAQWAAAGDAPFYPAPPEGVDYRFWEQNVWELAGSDATFAWIKTPFIYTPVAEADDVSFPLADFAAP
jgi:hypothetical protein